MVRKTRKQHSKKSKKGSHALTIPELRRSFEHIEKFVDEKIHSNESKEKIVKDLQKEWYHVFVKELRKKSAEEFVEERMKQCKSTRRHRTLRRKGGASALAGAPLDYMTRQGIYLAPESIPTAAGHLPLSNGNDSVFGSFVNYVSKGFWNPEIAQSYDPVKGQSAWPVPFAGMGSNLVKGGGRKLRRGGAMGTLLSDLAMHPIPGSAPPSVLKDMQDMAYGKQVGASPDQVQQQPNYQIGAIYPKAIRF